jgi:hypothetical protein
MVSHGTKAPPWWTLLARVTLSIDDEVAAQLDAFAEENSFNRSQAAEHILRKFFFAAEQQTEGPGRPGWPGRGQELRQSSSLGPGGRTNGYTRATVEGAGGAQLSR